MSGVLLVSHEPRWSVASLSLPLQLLLPHAATPVSTPITFHYSVLTSLYNALFSLDVVKTPNICFCGHPLSPGVFSESCSVPRISQKDILPTLFSLFLFFTYNLP